MNLKPRRHEEPEINVVSLIDVVLLLVVFFMLSSKFSDEGRLRVHLPQASAVPSAKPAGEPLVITVTQSGSYLVNQRELINSSPETLRAALLKEAGSNRARTSRSGPMRAPPTSRSSRPWTCSGAWASAKSTSPPSRKSRRASLERHQPSAADCRGRTARAQQRAGRLPAPARLPRAVPWSLPARHARRRAVRRSPWCCFAPFAKYVIGDTFIHRDPRSITWVPLALIGLFYAARYRRLHPDVLHGLRGAADRRPAAPRRVPPRAATADRLLRSQFLGPAAVAAHLQQRTDRPGHHRLGQHGGPHDPHGRSARLGICCG